jgi:PAS domain S-box-containing protein
MMPRRSLDQAAILVVDDRVENLIAVEAVLQPLGYPVVRALSGEEALRHVLLQDFALILLDVQMPGMNGFETAQLIKARERTRHTPIIFLTAISKDEKYVFEGYSAGAVDYLFKPFDPDILRSKVSVFIDLYNKGRQLQEQEQKLRQSERREMDLLHRTRLLESEARYAQIVDSATDAIITVGADGLITVFNAAAENTFGIPASAAIGRSVSDILKVSEPINGISAAPGAPSPDPDREVRKNPSLEGEAVRADGQRFPVEYTISTLSLQDGSSETLILRDISERKQAEAQLQAQKESLENTMEELRALNEELHERTVELELAIGSRSRFYASMSHELRTPINAILGYSSLLLDNLFGPLNEKQTSSLQRTHLAGTHLLELVNDILDLSKIEAGKLDLQFEKVPLPGLIEDLFVTVAPFAEKHQVVLSLEAPEESWRCITDPRKVRQIALNLLSNAIKFGTGSPVDVVCLRRDDGGFSLNVIDNGPGISAPDQERIFEEFVQLDQNVESPGTGLGLAISRRLAELLGGSITVTSTIGEGSTFRLEVPQGSEELIEKVPAEE